MTRQNAAPLFSTYFCPLVHMYCKILLNTRLTVTHLKKRGEVAVDSDGDEQMNPGKICFIWNLFFFFLIWWHTVKWMVLSTSAVKYYNPHDFGVTFLSAVFLQQSAVKFCCFICVFCCLLLFLATITHIILLAWEALPFPCQPCSHTHTHNHTQSTTTTLLWDYTVTIKANIYLCV